MNLFLKLLFTGIILAMIWQTGTASMAEALWDIPLPVAEDPWFVATLFDAYFGFLTFFLWVCYRENTMASRIFWFVLIMLLGNMAMASYCLMVLCRAPKDASFESLLLKPGPKTREVA